MKWTRFFTPGVWAIAAWAGPVTFEPAEVDFGIKAQGVHLEAEVKMTNTTAKELQVLHVTSDCSCTAGEPRKRRLGPGESTTMPVGMDPRSFLGPVVKRLVVQTSAGDAELRVKATIRAFEHWEVAPMPVILPSSLRQQAASATVRVSYTGPGKAEVLAASTDQPWLQADLAAEPSGSDATVTLRKLLTAPAGPQTAQLALKTSEPNQPQLTIRVFVPVLSATRVSPNPVILPTVKIGATATRDVAVSGWEEGVEPLARLPQGNVVARGRQPNGDYVFTVSVSPTTLGMHTQTLQVMLDENQVLVDVPVIVKAEL